MPKVITRAVAGVQIITINRPEVRNAIDEAAAVAIAAALDELDGADDLAVGVITGAPPSFCSGMDLKAFLAGERPGVPGRGFAGITERSAAKPLIAAVEGHALAGGFEIVLACDLIVAAETAMFGLPEPRRGLIAAAGGLLRLPERIPYHLAMEWALTGALIPAAQAHAAGLINRLTGQGGALDGALELAAQLRACAPLALRATKKIISESPGSAAPGAFDWQRTIGEPVRASQDAREGALAFTQKRPPQWRGA